MARKKYVTKGPAMVELVCPQCGNTLYRKQRKLHKTKNGLHFCDSTCSGYYYKEYLSNMYIERSKEFADYRREGYRRLKED